LTLEPKWLRIILVVMYIYIYMRDLRRGVNIYIYVRLDIYNLYPEGARRAKGAPRPREGGRR